MNSNLLGKTIISLFFCFNYGYSQSLNQGFYIGIGGNTTWLKGTGRIGDWAFNVTNDVIAGKNTGWSWDNNFLYGIQPAIGYKLNQKLCITTAFEYYLAKSGKSSNEYIVTVGSAPIYSVKIDSKSKYSEKSLNALLQYYPFKNRLSFLIGIESLFLDSRAVRENVFHHPNSDDVFTTILSTNGSGTGFILGAGFEYQANQYSNYTVFAQTVYRSARHEGNTIHINERPLSETRYPSELNISGFSFNLGFRYYFKNLESFLEKNDWKKLSNSKTVSEYQGFLQKHPHSEFSNQVKSQLEILYEHSAWEKAKSSNTMVLYEEFIRRYPKSEFSDSAQIQIEFISWNNARVEDTIDGYKNFLKRNSKSEFAKAAYSRIEYLSWQIARSGDIIDGYEEFLRQYPYSEFAKAAHLRIEYLLWQDVREENSIDGYEKFLKQYPESEFFTLAQEYLDELYAELRIWEQTKKEGSVASIRRFISNYPDSRYVEEAKAEIRNYESDIYGRHIIDALKNGRVKVEVEGSDIKSVMLKIKRLVNHRIKIIVPAATFFVCDGSAQNMVSRKTTTISLDSNDWQVIYINAACANRSREIPYSGDTFVIHESPYPYQEELKRLITVLEKSQVSFEVEQAAVWIITDDADYSDLGILKRRSAYEFSGGTRMIREYEAAMAMKLCDIAGVDITQKSIWSDRELIIRGLKQENLKYWLRQKPENY